MKTTATLVVLALLITGLNESFAQNENTGKNEIRVGYGLLTGPEMANSLFSLWPAIGVSIWKDTIKDYNCSFRGAVTVEYNRFVKPWCTVGASLSINPISTLITTKHGYEMTWSYYLISIMPKVNFIYFNKGPVSMYSGIEAGCSLILWRDRQGAVTMNDTGLSAAFQINGFGIRVGREIGGFVEWGYGFRGIVNFGLSARF